jgi:hypothetical protein
VDKDKKTIPFPLMEEVIDEQERKKIEMYRMVFFGHWDKEGVGMRVLEHMLKELGHFTLTSYTDTQASLENVARQNYAKRLLINLGVYHPVNDFDILQAFKSIPVKRDIFTVRQPKKPLIGGK